jgi:hypothetical protein
VQQLQEEQDGVEEDAEQQQEWHEEEGEMRLTMSGARDLADQLLAMLQRQNMSASGAGAAAAEQLCAGSRSPRQQQQQRRRWPAEAARAW